MEQIAHYKITGKLGEGGMGAVYRATDTKLNRDVAIKVLPAALAHDADYIARFQREAQTLAALNHPNIATIFGIEDNAIIMELVEGATLQGPMDLPDALPLARQIAEALEAAHEKGIIHRDLKPGNVMVTPSGLVKVLDFGLAKAVAERPVSTGPNSPTLTMRATEAGIILGTAAYMSPEQAAGKPVDRRADIWSFGVVLHELLTGKRLFDGETVTHTLADVVKGEIDFSGIPEGSIRELVKRCLDRNIKSRLSHIAEARIAIENYAPPQPAPVVIVERRSVLPWAVAALALAGCAVAAWMWPKPPEHRPAVARFFLPLPEGTQPVNFRAAPNYVPSPDGRHLAIALENATTKESELWIRPLGSTSAHAVDKTGRAAAPFWSPDSQHIGFFSEGKLKRVAVSGGVVQTICQFPSRGGSSGDGGAWSAEGFLLFAPGNGGLLRVAATGGVPSPATELEKDEVAHLWPQFLPDGRHVLYLSRNSDGNKNAIYVQELGTKNRVRVMENLTRAAWAPPGYLLYARDESLFARQMNAKSFALEGEPALLAENVSVNDDGRGRANFATSQNGVLAYGPLRGEDEDRQLSWYDRGGKRLGALGKPGKFGPSSLSPDGRRVAVLVQGDRLTADTWMIDIESGVMTRMTRDGEDNNYVSPAWTPDSQRLAVTNRDGGFEKSPLRPERLRPWRRIRIAPTHGHRTGARSWPSLSEEGGFR